MTFSASITERTRSRKRKNGTIVVQEYYVLNFKDPRTGGRRQKFYTRRKAAEAKRNELLVQFAAGTYADPQTVPTVSKSIDHWLADKVGKVKGNTLESYKVVVAHIRYSIGTTRISELTTAAIRAWHTQLAGEVGIYTANRAKQHLKAVLGLAEEDFGVRGPSMPTGTGRSRQKLKKAILATADIARVIEAAKADAQHGIYYGFPFLAGTRPSEQLGLLWADIDFEANVVRISRVQERDGTLTYMTKTEAGTREVPMGPTLRAMLLDWRVRCPRLRGELHRVFPGPGRLQPWPKPRTGGGGPVLYQNWRRRYWVPVFKKLALPYVTPHSARHSFISTMQAQGIEVGLVAKLAGHASAQVTLGHYTQAVRGGESAAAALDNAYTAKPSPSQVELHK
jgi:integrase